MNDVERKRNGIRIWEASEASKKDSRTSVLAPESWRWTPRAPFYRELHEYVPRYFLLQERLHASATDFRLVVMQMGIPIAVPPI